MNDNFRQDIFNLLNRIPTRKLDGLRELWAELGYDQANHLISTRQWPTSETETLAEPPRIIATTATNGDFRIIYGRLNDSQLRLTPQRPIINRLIQDNPFGLFVFSNNSQTEWHLVNVKYETLRVEEEQHFDKLSVTCRVELVEAHLGSKVSRSLGKSTSAISTRQFGK